MSDLRNSPRHFTNTLSISFMRLVDFKKLPSNSVELKGQEPPEWGIDWWGEASGARHRGAESQEKAKSLGIQVSEDRVSWPLIPRRIVL